MFYHKLFQYTDVKSILIQQKVYIIISRALVFGLSNNVHNALLVT